MLFRLTSEGSIGLRWSVLPRVIKLFRDRITVLQTSICPLNQVHPQPCNVVLQMNGEINGC